MKRFITILVFTLMAFVANAQFRITPMVDINLRTYNETLEIVSIMERASFIEKIEGVRLEGNPNRMTTSGGEVVIQKGTNYIKIIPVEFTKMLNDYLCYPNRRWYPLESIRSELMVQNVDMYDYICRYLTANRRIKNVYIKIDPMNGGSYIIINYRQSL